MRGGRPPVDGSAQRHRLAIRRPPRCPLHQLAAGAASISGGPLRRAQHVPRRRSRPAAAAHTGHAASAAAGPAPAAGATGNLAAATTGATATGRTAGNLTAAPTGATATGRTARNLAATAAGPAATGRATGNLTAAPAGAAGQIGRAHV